MWNPLLFWNSLLLWNSLPLLWERAPARDRGREAAPTPPQLASHTSTAASHTSTTASHTPSAVRELLFTCSRWLRAEAWYDPERFLFVGTASGRDVTVRLECLDPGPYIRARFDEFGGHVRFSGTVSPLSLYAHLHGEAEGPVERAGNPFDASQLRVLVVDDIATYLNARGRTAPRVAELIDSVTRTRPGHYLVAFPSFDYLNLVWEQVEQTRSPECASPVERLRQTPAMTEEERAAFLSAFGGDAPPTVGFVVLGGVFGESVDFSMARLTGVICVGVGLPPPSFTRSELKRHFDGRGLDGAAIAFHQPAMVKVLQMAGRLLRSPQDRGVLVLVDPRFAEPAYARFFPDHWRPAAVGARRVATELTRFWQS